MGCVRTITAENFPKQSSEVNRMVEVCFHYDTSKQVAGRIVRDDREEPFETIIWLEDGRFVRGTECQYSFAGPRKAGKNK